ncbi:hypothetical protein [Kordiimonas marina]|uniref:hypothetical protein n=1 Tax=Kordiimonas marina TaxID=2872312 RepID=UPI001FF32628|nr:hypothetical protein [Kordiimonas marina]MCJ9429581.1 hypothetical protein [Kordiimonas marina]
MKGERIGWVLSAVLHVGVATVALVGLPSLHHERPAPPPPIDIDFVKIADKTTAAAPKAEKQQEQQAPQHSVAAAEPVPETATEAMPLPKPAPKVKDIPKPTPKPKVSEREKLRNSVRVHAKPKPPSRLKLKNISSVIDRALKEEQIATKEGKKQEEKQVAKKKEEAKPDPFAGIRGRIAAASLRDALSQKLAKCWTFPRGAKGVEDMQVTVRIYLRPDGTLARIPEFVGVGDLNDPSRGFYRTFAESARRAVQLCEPYKEAMQYLPKGTGYIDFNFSGAEFAGD